MFSQFDLHLLSFSSAGSAFTSTITCKLFFWSIPVYPEALLKNFISNDVNSFFFLSFSLKVYVSLLYRSTGRASALYTFFLEDFWTNAGLGCVHNSQYLSKFWVVLLNNSHFQKKVHNWDISNFLHCKRLLPQHFYIFLGVVLKRPSPQVFWQYLHFRFFPIFLMQTPLSLNYSLNQLLCLDRLLTEETKSRCYCCDW